MSQSLQGQFLVASGQLRDGNFYRSVVLMLEHSEESAMGLVINRPSSISVDAALSKLKVTSKYADPIFSGGPVETTALFILHNCPELGQMDQQIADGIYVTGSQDSFDSLLNKGVTCNHECGFRVYCGYAGWGPQQLESEIGRGDWRILSPDSGLVFNKDPYTIWEKCTELLQQQHRLLPHDVRNAEWN
ncbi:MAG: YqgE/AlgH family protein [Planctomycetaceae bacterium]|nr:YqgE/AlgH family protein [Planctomycetaceae bacterium]